MTRTTEYTVAALPTPQIVGPYSRWPRQAQNRTAPTAMFSSISGVGTPATSRTTQRPAMFAGLSGAATPAKR